jgi:hypothetical protein
MADWSVTYAAVLFGLVLLITIYKALVLWQMERTPLTICSFLVFASLQFLYLVTAAHWPTTWRDVARVVFLTALVGDNVFGWRALIVFLSAKNAGIVDAKIEQAATSTSTLGSVAETQAATVVAAPVALEATEKEK